MPAKKPTIIKRAPKTRAFKIGTRAIVATVYADAYAQGNGQFRHPCIVLGVMGAGYGDGTEERFEELATVKFQQHRLEDRERNRQPRGILASQGWSHAYGGTFSGAVQYRSERGKATKILALLDRVEDATTSMRYTRPRSERRADAMNDDMLAMMIGLRHCGVEVRVYRPEVERPRIGGYGSLSVSQ